MHTIECPVLVLETPCALSALVLIEYVGQVALAAVLSVVHGCHENTSSALHRLIRNSLA